MVPQKPQKFENFHFTWQHFLDSQAIQPVKGFSLEIFFKKKPPKSLNANKIESPIYMTRLPFKKANIIMIHELQSQQWKTYALHNSDCQLLMIYFMRITKSLKEK